MLIFMSLGRFLNFQESDIWVKREFKRGNVQRGAKKFSLCLKFLPYFCQAKWPAHVQPIGPDGTCVTKLSSINCAPPCIWPSKRAKTSSPFFCFKTGPAQCTLNRFLGRSVESGGQNATSEWERNKGQRIQWKLLIGLTFVLEEVNPKSNPTL